MANLEEITDFKEEAMRLIVTSPRIMKLVANNEVECFIPPVENPGSYLYENIFPYKHTLLETEDEKKTYITMDFADFGLVNSNFKDFVMAIYIFTHRDLMRIKEGNNNKLRIDTLASEIDKIFNRSRDFGIGRLVFNGMQSLTVNRMFQGVTLLYKTVDFDVESDKVGLPR